MSTFFSRSIAFCAKYLFTFSMLLSISLSAYAALPPSISEKLKKAGISEEEVSVTVIDADPSSRNVLLTHNEKRVMHPASVMKLVTTFAALDLLGPEYTWKTAAFIDGEISSGTLVGNLYLRGSGDPSMTIDKMRELLLQVQAAGIKKIQGNLYIDRSAYDIPDIDPSAFDGEPLRPYNVRPDTLLINYKTVAFTFNTWGAQAGTKVPVLMSPKLTGVRWDPSVVLSDQKCGDWQKNLNADFSDPLNIKFNGSLPQSCGLKQWYVAFPEPRSHSLRAIGALWQEIGGSINGLVSFDSVPPAAKLIAAVESKSLAEVVRDVNKYSNNVMAQSVFLALSLPDQKTFLSSKPLLAAASYDRSKEIVMQWWQTYLPHTQPPIIENGSGLSRIEAVSSQSLALMLRQAWRSAAMPEFVSSLPIAAVDGTMRRSKATAKAHIKTGTVRDVVARAGYILDAQGHRKIMVLLINSPRYYEAQEVIDALIDWVAEN